MLKGIVLKMRSNLLMNSFWGVLANLTQNIFFSIFFVLIARNYNEIDFSSYILANTVYGLVLAFSSLGLGQWFVRALIDKEDKEALIYQFFKLQCIIGIFFYGINIALAFILYKDPLIRQLCVIIGLNIIFDNIIYVIKHINIAQLDQKTTFLIQTIESLFKFMLGCVIVIFPISMILLVLIIILLRFLTLNIFLHIGTNYPLKLSNFISAKIDFNTFKTIVIKNWPFIVIGSISVLFWKMGNILISNFLNLSAVAHYEISFKLFSIAEVIPVIVSASIFPVLMKKLKEDKNEAMLYYKKIFLGYTLYGCLTFSFIYSFSDQIIPLLFGTKYILTVNFCKEMFLTMLVFPTAILQANLMIALHLEKVDMLLNIFSLILNLCISLLGLYFIKSITVINISILISFTIFHILQDYVLIKKRFISLKSTILFYVFIGVSMSIFYVGSKVWLPFLLFLFFWIILLSAVYYYFFYYLKKNEPVSAI